METKLDRLMVLAIRMLIVVFAMRYVGFSSEQTLVLGTSLVLAMGIK